MPVEEEGEDEIVPREDVKEAERLVWAACEDIERERWRGTTAGAEDEDEGASSAVPARGSRGAMVLWSLAAPGGGIEGSAPTREGEEESGGVVVVFVVCPRLGFRSLLKAVFFLSWLVFACEVQFGDEYSSHRIETRLACPGGEEAGRVKSSVYVSTCVYCPDVRERPVSCSVSEKGGSQSRRAGGECGRI